MAGDGDGIVSASDMEALAQALPRSTSATVANAGHVPMLEAGGGQGLILPTGEHSRLRYLGFCVSCNSLFASLRGNSLSNRIHTSIINHDYAFIDVHTVQKLLVETLNIL